MNSVIRIATAAILISWPGAAFAHGGNDTAGFAHGFMHPLGGLDHVLAMVAVGLYAALLGGRALGLVPATFVGVMALAGALGAAGCPLPYTESAIALSVILLGLAVALRVSLPASAALALVGMFAVFHGHAHGSDASGFAYAAGFLLATALLHCAGIAIGLAAGKLAEGGGWRVAQAAGGAMALAGIGIITGLV